MGLLWRGMVLLWRRESRYTGKWVRSIAKLVTILKDQSTLVLQVLELFNKGSQEARD